MSFSIPCPACKAQLQVREEYAGKSMSCPKCGAGFEVPTPSAHTGVAEVQLAGAPSEGPTKPCPHCGKRISVVAKKCRFCKTWIDEEREDEDEDDDDRPAARYKPCPKCGGRGAERVLWTFWGSFYGPALFCHVRCPKCRYGYNGRSGGSNLIPAIIMVAVPLLGIAAIIGGLAFLIMNLSRF